MTKFTSRRPAIFALAAVLLALVIISLLSAGLGYLKLSPLARQVIIEAVFCGYVGVLLTRLRWWNEAGFKRPISRQKLLVCLPLLLLPMLMLVSGGIKSASAGQVIGFAIFALLVGFAEEGLVRGLALRAILPTGLMRATLLSSLFFGLGHLINVGQGASLSAMAVQVTESIFLGIGFTGVRLYTGSIWPAIALHSLIDFIDAGSRGFVLAPSQVVTLIVLVPIILTGLFAAYGWWLLQRTETKPVSYPQPGSLPAAP
jgi:membrane protease YdiL (CAAX protease family)